MRGGTLPGARIIAVGLRFPEYSACSGGGLCRTAVTKSSPSRYTALRHVVSDTRWRAWRIGSRRARLRWAPRERPPDRRAASAARAEAAAAEARGVGPGTGAAQTRPLLRLCGPRSYR